LTPRGLNPKSKAEEELLAAQSATARDAKSTSGKSSLFVSQLSNNPPAIVSKFPDLYYLLM
jgi:hypothetical protein